MQPTRLLLQNALDEDIGSEGEAERSIQVMQIDLAQETVEDMRKSAGAGRTLSLGFGKHLVSPNGAHALGNNRERLIDPFGSFCAMVAPLALFVQGLRRFVARSTMGNMAGRASKTWSSRGLSVIQSPLIEMRSGQLQQSSPRKVKLL